jgi:hypothetical protein
MVNRFENMGCVLHKHTNPSISGVTEEETIRITRDLAEIQTGHIPNTSPDRVLYINLFGRSYVLILCLLMGPVPPSFLSSGYRGSFPRR